MTTKIKLIFKIFFFLLLSLNNKHCLSHFNSKKIDKKKHFFIYLFLLGVFLAFCNFGLTFCKSTCGLKLNNGGGCGF